MKTDCFKIRVSKTLLAQAICARQTLAGTDIDVLTTASLAKELCEIDQNEKKKADGFKDIVKRLRWHNVDKEGKVISIPLPTHGKTGGCCHVGIPVFLGGAWGPRTMTPPTTSTRFAT